MASYRVSGGQLIIDQGTGSEWCGKPLGTNVLQVDAIPGSVDCIILCDYSGAPGEVRNMARVDTHGSVRWVAEVPAGDAYIGLRWEDEHLHANTWNGFHVELDAASGAILTTRFVK